MLLRTGSTGTGSPGQSGMAYNRPLPWRAVGVTPLVRADQHVAGRFLAGIPLAGNNAAERRAGPTDSQNADHDVERVSELEVLAQ